MTRISERVARAAIRARQCRCLSPECTREIVVRIGATGYCMHTATVIAGCTGCNRPRVLCECLLAVQA